MANIPASAKREAIKKVKKTLAKEGIKLKDIKLAKGKAPKKPLKVVNPLTGRKMAKDGPTFKKLIEQGFKFISVKKANRQMIAGVLVPPKNVIESFAKENKVPEENVRQVVATRVANIASGIFGGAPVTAPNREPNREPNLRQMQMQRNVLAEKPRLNEAERKEMNVLNRNINQVTNLNRVENKLNNIRPVTAEVRENIGAVRETRAEVPVAENKFKAVIGNAEEVVIKANENVLTQRENREPRAEVAKAEPTPKTKINVNANSNRVNVGNNRMGIAKNNGTLATRNVTSGAAPPMAPVGNVRPIGNKTENKEKEAKNFDRTLGEALSKIV
jgi:hypothetical protein